MKTPILLVLLAVLGTSCSRLTTKTDMVFDPLPDGPATFDLVQKTVFNGSCALSGCHGNNVSPDLSAGLSYANIVNVKSSREMVSGRTRRSGQQLPLSQNRWGRRDLRGPHASGWTVP